MMDFIEWIMMLIADNFPLILLLIIIILILGEL